MGERLTQDVDERLVKDGRIIFAQTIDQDLRKTLMKDLRKTLMKDLRKTVDQFVDQE